MKKLLLRAAALLLWLVHAEWQEKLGSGNVNNQINNYMLLPE